MRKYFLTTAIALLTATNVNASEGKFNASVAVRKATKIECWQNLDFGTIVVTGNGQATTATLKVTDDMANYNTKIEL